MSKGDKNEFGFSLFDDTLVELPDKEIAISTVALHKRR